MNKTLEKFLSPFSFIKKALVNAIFVKDIKCITCGAELKIKNKYGLCNKCLNTLPFNNKHICYKCGDSISGRGSYCLNCKDTQKEFEFARAPFIYEDKIRSLIYKLKYSSGQYLAPYISYLLLDEYIRQDWQVDYVIPVPLHKSRQRKRGFNQAELIGCKFESILAIKILKDNLIRSVATPTQTKLTRKERKANLDKAFKVVDKKTIKNKNILLIDDVYTTGATAEECSKTLKKAGVKNVYVLTLAHVKKSVAVI